MAGKIIADQIEHSTAGSLDTSYVVNGSAKAWITFSGNGTTVRDSSNTSSLVDDGAGIYSYNLTSSMSNANYTSNSSASYINDTSNYETYLAMNYVGNLSATRTTGQNNVGFWDAAFADPNNDACSSILGDLA
jgi:hypothetical protein